MTSFFYRSTVALLALGGAILGAGAVTDSALALSQELINDQLGDVPVFTLSDAEGNTLSTSITNSADESESVSITRIFISPADAEAALTSIQQEDPELAEAFQVTPMPLSQIYKAAIETKDNNENVIFDFVPIEEEVDYAMSLPDIQEQAPGWVPLFLVSSRQKPEGATEGDVSENATENVGRFTLRDGDEEVIPMFFQQAPATNILNFLEQDQPELAEHLFVDVIWLESFISALANADDSNTDIQQYQMVPTAESLDFLKEKLQPATPANEAAE